MLPIPLHGGVGTLLGNLAYVVTHDSGLYSIVPLIAPGAAITGQLCRDRPDARAPFGICSGPTVGAARAPSIGPDFESWQRDSGLCHHFAMLGTGVVLAWFRQGLDPEPHGLVSR